MRAAGHLQHQKIYCSFATSETGLSALETYTEIAAFPHTGSVVTTGTFDGIHKGHRVLIEKALETARASRLPMVAVTYWPHPRTVLSGQSVPLLTTLEEKLQLMEKAGVEHAVVYPFTRALAAMPAEAFLRQLTSRLRIRHLIVGADHRMGQGGECTAPQIAGTAAALGVTTDIVSLMDADGQRISSSRIRACIAAGDTSQAAALLGHPYLITGKVTAGDRIGRTIGYPTANLLPTHSDKLLPANGVYAVRVEADGQWFCGMMYIGGRPTLNLAGSTGRIEVHLFDFNGDLYEKTLHVHCMERIRDEVHADGLEDLRHRLQEDERRCRSYLNKL